MYLLGLEGIALLRAFAGEYDEKFTLARLAETRGLLDMADRLGPGACAAPIATQDGYRGWAPFYDSPGNQLVDIEQPIVQQILADFPVGVALDAACGTGRHAAYLAELGHQVIAVDSSPEMLAVARNKLPSLEFHEADLHQLPVPDQAVDVVVCALALTHVPDLECVLAEFARVLRPGGHLVISDSRGVIDGVGLPMLATDAEDRWVYMPVWQRRASQYLAAALPLGFEVRRCEEPRRPNPLVRPDAGSVTDSAPPPEHDPNEPPDIWALHAYAAEATNATYHDLPAAIIWHFQMR
ncbi:MAG: class I SAM-dependent methyltransferase [Geodermatophilaceae bacterium]